MADLLEDLQTYFSAKGIMPVQSIFRDASPDKPASAVILYEYIGAGSLPQIAGATRNVQIVARDQSATTAKLKARELYHALETEDGILFLTDSRWSLIYIKQPPFKLKVENDLTYYCFNVSITTYVD
ncbi:hypothetical protein D3C75_158440 [compost metagenome]